MRISDWSSDVCSSDLKGVATMLGLSLALAWPIGLVFAFLWIDVVLLLRISSLGGMVGAVSAPIAALLFGYPVYAVGLAGLALIVLWRHRENIARLRAGTEPPVGGDRQSTRRNSRH